MANTSPINIDSLVVTDPKKDTAHMFCEPDDCSVHSKVSIPKHHRCLVTLPHVLVLQQHPEEEYTINRAFLSVVFRVEVGAFLKIAGIDFHDHGMVICLGCNKDLWSQRSKYKSYGALRGCDLGARDCLQV